LLAVEDANANAAPPADLAVWRPSSGMWYDLGGVGSAQTFHQWGMNGDDPVEGDYDGDGKTDFAIFRAGAWWITKRSDNTYYTFTFGESEDEPAQADFDGDGKTDPAVFHPDGSLGYWKILRSSDSQLQQSQFGLHDDTPAPADYDGDGNADIAVWRNTNTPTERRRSSIFSTAPD